MNNDPSKPEISRSFIIPVLDMSPHSPYNIKTLLSDLEKEQGEVICIFNNKSVYEELHTHPRINKYCYNNLNAGVSRSWNIGINLAEGEAAFILNADVHIQPEAIGQLESYLFTLDKAVIVGPQGTHIDYGKLGIIRYFEKGTFHEPVQTHDVSGFFFAIHRDRFLKNHLLFDVQFSPCFFEEWDMGLQVMRAKLACYAVPVGGFEHHWGASQYKSLSVNYFGKNMTGTDIMRENRQRFITKWNTTVSVKN